MNPLGKVVNRLTEVTKPLEKQQSQIEKLLGGVAVTNMAKPTALKTALNTFELSEKAITSLELGEISYLF